MQTVMMSLMGFSLVMLWAQKKQPAVWWKRGRQYSSAILDFPSFIGQCLWCYYALIIIREVDIWQYKYESLWVINAAWWSHISVYKAWKINYSVFACDYPPMLQRRNSVHNGSNRNGELVTLSSCWILLCLHWSCIYYHGLFWWQNNLSVLPKLHGLITSSCQKAFSKYRWLRILNHFKVCLVLPNRLIIKPLYLFITKSPLGYWVIIFFFFSYN